MVDFPCEIPLVEVAGADVLFCRGKSVHNHKGNVVYREVVRQRASKYQSQESTIFDRDNIAREVIQLVHDSGGRFLCPVQESQSTAWFECPHRITRVKVKQALRDMNISGGLKKSKSKSPRKKEEVNRPKEEQLGLVPVGNSFDRTSTMRNSNCAFGMIHEDREQQGTSSEKNTDFAPWEEVQEFCSGGSYRMPSISHGAQNWFPGATRPLPQASSLHDGLNAIPLFPKSIHQSSRELAIASLRICYMDLLRGQTSSRSSLDSETIDILRRIRDS